MSNPPETKLKKTISPRKTSEPKIPAATQKLEKSKATQPTVNSAELKVKKPSATTKTIKAKSATPTKAKRAVKETSQLLALLAFDAECHEPHRERHRYLIGLDEVGRGSLISSVVAGACCWPLGFSHNKVSPEQLSILQTLNDSKQMKIEQRTSLAPLLHELAYIGLGEASVEEINRLNIHHASLLASYRAFEKVLKHLNSLDESVSAEDCFVLLDGRCYLPQLPRNAQQAIVKGDGLSAVIAAASVVAKHARDTTVIELADQYPGYGWERNMGYATPAHREGIEKLGITPLHRQNYKVVHEQLALFEQNSFSTD